jgi:hypothetical protein
MHIVFFQIYISSYYILQIAADYDAIRDAIRSSKEIFKFIEEADKEREETRNTEG